MKGRKRAACAGLALLLSVVGIAPGYTGAKGKQLQLNCTSKTMIVGNSLRLRVKGRVAKSKKIIWKSSRRSVAAVTGQGKVTAKRAGKTQIIVRIPSMNKKAVCSLTVREKVPSAMASPSVPPAQGEVSPSPDSSETAGTMPAATGDSNPILTAQPNTSAHPSTSPIPGDSPPHGGNEATVMPPATVKPSSCPIQTAQPSLCPTQSSQPDDGPSGSVMPSPCPSSSPAVAPVAVDSSVLVVQERIITTDNTVMTAYLINKKFSGEISVSLNGKEYSVSSSGRSLLSVLKRGTATEENADGTIRVSRTAPEEEYWTIEDRQYQKTYYMKADTVNTLDTSLADCGVIYILGDVRSEVKISGKVQT